MPQKVIDQKTKDKAIEMLKEKISAAKVAEKLGVSSASVTQWKKKAGLTKSRDGVKTAVKAKATRGRPAKKAKQFGTSTDAYTLWLTAGLKNGYIDRLKGDLAKV